MLLSREEEKASSLERDIEQIKLSADHSVYSLKDQISTLQTSLFEEEEKLAVMFQQLVECNDERTELRGFYDSSSLPICSFIIPYIYLFPNNIIYIDVHTPLFPTGHLDLNDDLKIQLEHQQVLVQRTKEDLQQKEALLISVTNDLHKEKKQHQKSKTFRLLFCLHVYFFSLSCHNFFLSLTVYSAYQKFMIWNGS